MVFEDGARGRGLLESIQHTRGTELVGLMDNGALTDHALGLTSAGLDVCSLGHLDLSYHVQRDCSGSRVDLEKVIG